MPSKTKPDLIFCDDCGVEVDAKETQQIKFCLGPEMLFDIRVCGECAERAQVAFEELKSVPKTS